MKSFKEKQIQDLKAITGGAGPGDKTRATVKAYGFFDGEIGNECFEKDRKMKK